MALGTILGGLASGAASAGLSMLGSKLFGGGNPTEGLENFKPTGINAGGLTTSFKGGNIGIKPTAERLAQVGAISGEFGQQAEELGRLRERVAPGVSDLRIARLAEIENARNAAMGNLRENLQRRRVLGSSFGMDALMRGEAEFAKERDRVAAESFLQEFEMTNQAINQEFATKRATYQTFLDEMNLEAQTAAALAGKATETMGKIAQTEAQLLAVAAQGAGKMFGMAFQPFGSAIGQGVSGFFGGSPIGAKGGFGG